MNHNVLQQFEKLIALDRIDPREIRQEMFDLSRFQRFLDQVGNPERGLPAIHVAGSKGKGSTTVLLGAALQGLGKRVGVFMSPYLHEPRQSIFVDGMPMPASVFSEFMVRYEPLFAHHTVTSFEVLTAMALQYFHQMDVDFAILETGLGGRLDATNVIESPLLSIICPIEKEHTEILGNSITSIAYEKLGIVREGVPVIVAAQEDSFVLDFAKNVCAQKASPTISVAGRYESFILHRSPEHYLFRLKTPTRDISSIALAMLGDHQVRNAMTAWAALDLLFPDFDPSSVLDVWAHLTLEGRFELHRFEGSPLIFDGAHTVASVKALRKTLDQLYGSRSIFFVLAFLNDKDVEGMIRALIRAGDMVMVTQVPHPRALPAREVEERLKSFFVSQNIRCILTNTLSVTKQKILKIAPKNPLCITGSFKLVEAMKPLILNEIH